MSESRTELLGDLLKATSRSFSLAQRLEALRALRERIAGQGTAALNFGELARQQGLPAERVLLEKVEASLALLATLSPADLTLVRAVLATIISGQELDLQRFGRGEEAAAGIQALATDAELDDYTYRVAGCVGEFWTKICRAHLFPKASLDEQKLIADGIRFGQGLQLVNILRDIPADLKNGRCYLPADRLAAAGLTPENLLEVRNETVFLPLFRGYLDLAEGHLVAGWRYTNTLPFGQFRVRLACSWPVLFGLRTVVKLRAAGAEGLRQRVKITRGEVRGILFRSLLASPFPGLWRGLDDSAGRRGK